MRPVITERRSDAHLPPARERIGDRGYGSGRFRLVLQEKGIKPCIPSTRSRKAPILSDPVLYRQRQSIENLLRMLKEWRRIAMRYDRCAYPFVIAISLAATVTFLLGQ